MTPPFKLDLQPEREHLVLAVHGELDLAAVPQVSAALEGAAADGWTSVVLDLRDVSFMDSAGVHLLVEAAALEAQGVRCSMVDGNPAVERVLELTGHPRPLPKAEPHHLGG